MYHVHDCSHSHNYAETRIGDGHLAPSSPLQARSLAPRSGSPHKYLWIIISSMNNCAVLTSPDVNYSAVITIWMHTGMPEVLSQYPTCTYADVYILVVTVDLRGIYQSICSTTRDKTYQVVSVQRESRVQLQIVQCQLIIQIRLQFFPMPKELCGPSIHQHIKTQENTSIFPSFKSQAARVINTMNDSCIWSK